MGCTAEAAKCVVHLGRSYPREDPSCTGLVPTAKTTLNPAHLRPRPERRALHKVPRLDDTIKPGITGRVRAVSSFVDLHEAAHEGCHLALCKVTLSRYPRAAQKFHPGRPNRSR